MDFDYFSSSLPSYYHLIFISLALLFSTLIYLITTDKSKPKKRGRVPPGPPGWPIVGNLFQFSNSGKQFFEYVRELIPEYGPIMTLKMGSRNMIIISGAELAHEALIGKGQTFATRPSENPTRIVFSCNKFTVNAALYGPVWRSLRRNMVQNMLSSSRLKEFQEVRDSAMDKLIEKLKAEAEGNNGGVWVLKNARFAVFCILLAMCFGVEMDEETIERMDQMMKLVLITLDPRIDDYLPILRPFFSKQRKNAMEVRQKQIDTLVPFIEKRRAILLDPASDPKAASFSYLDTLFDLKIENRKHAPTNPEIVTLCSEFLNGGTDTTGTAVEWAIARLIENPSIQDKLYSEIRATVGPDRKVGEKDLDNMVYLHAFVKELLRKHPPTYFSLTHAVSERTILAGYEIPTDTNVEFFLPGIAEDPKLWSNPQKFDPDRFITGKEDADITGVKDVKMLPFGAGRRICPGLSMATVHLHLMIARMVQEFEWSAYPQWRSQGFRMVSRDTTEPWLGSYHILAAGLNGYMATVTNLKNPVNKWKCGAAPFTSMMTVKRYSRGPGALSIGKPAIHPATVDLKGKGYELLRQNAARFLLDDIYRNPGPVQFDGPGADAKAVSLCVEDQDYMGRIKKLQEYLDKVKTIVKPGCSQDVLKAALSAMASVTDILSVMSVPSNGVGTPF